MMESEIFTGLGEYAVNILFTLFALCGMVGSFMALMPITPAVARAGVILLWVGFAGILCLAPVLW